MNPKAISLLSPVINQEANSLLAMNPKAVSLLSPVFNQEANPASCNEPKERWSLVFSVQPRRPSLKNSRQE